MHVARLQGKRIFYVEDDVKNRAIIQMLLEREGAVMGFERWGRKETVEKIKEFMPVDLILLDLMFPRGVTGYDVFDHIREEADLAEIPVVAVSASDPAVEIPKTRKRGFSGFISKPVSIHTFAQNLEAVLKGEKIWS
jgi:two-component system chemotaxis sensor kinase CheA